MDRFEVAVALYKFRLLEFRVRSHIDVPIFPGVGLAARLLKCCYLDPVDEQCVLILIEFVLELLREINETSASSIRVRRLFTVAANYLLFCATSFVAINVMQCSV